MSRKRKKVSDCRNCDECVYVGDGDFACMKSNPCKIVYENHSTPTDDYLWCRGKKKGSATDQSTQNRK